VLNIDKSQSKYHKHSIMKIMFNTVFFLRKMLGTSMDLT